MVLLWLPLWEFAQEASLLWKLELEVWLLALEFGQELWLLWQFARGP